MDILENINKGLYQSGLAKRLTLSGKPQEFPSYKIPIELLFFNDNNGRISTYIQEYEASHNGESVLHIKDESAEKYNDLIASFIKASSNDNEVSFLKTKADIKEKNQKEPGVILSDGRIIDGNRRFTAIRELYKETGDLRFAYFECVCLPVPQNENQLKEIKTLELNIQFNEDKKREYNKIDFLVSFYNDVLDKKMLDEKSYMFAIGMKPNEFKKNKECVEAMLDYLERCGKPKAFYLLKNYKLDGPIEEIASKFKKMSEEERNDKKQTIYSYMTITIDEGDRTRNLRDLIKSAQGDKELFCEIKKQVENPETLNKVLKYVEHIDIKPTSPDESREFENNKNELKSNITRAFNHGKYLEEITKGEMNPITVIKTSVQNLHALDNQDLIKLNDNSKDEVNKKLNDLESEINRIRDAIK